MRTLRWAAELAVSSHDDARAALGVAQLIALGESDLLDETQKLFVDAALEAVLGDAVEEVEEAGEDVEVVRSLGAADGGDVELGPQSETEGRDG